MATIICLNDKCPFRSKKPLKTWRVGDQRAYSCTQEGAVFKPIFDPDGDAYGLYGYTPTICSKYEEYSNSLREESNNEHNSEE